MKLNKKRWLVAILALVGVLVVLVGIKTLQIVSMVKAGKSFAPPPEAVTSAKADAVEWQATRAAVGTLVAIRGVTLGAELTGAVRQISFDNGSSVKKGAVLVKLDTSTEEAQLAGAVADAELAKLTLERARNLRKDEVNTTAELEAAQARATQADSTVRNLRATIAKKSIRAPFDGRIAIRQVELGQVVSSGTPIASLQTVDPIYAEFSLPQQALADVKVAQKTRIRVDIFPGSTWDGEITTINPEVDPSTRNVRIRATIANPDGRLKPGMFASVEVLSGDTRNLVAIPATSVIFAPYGDSVFVIEEKKDPSGKEVATARQKFVRLGERRGDYVAVASGLTAGETVVANGAFKLRNGSAVMVNNALAPAAAVGPKPAEN